MSFMPILQEKYKKNIEKFYFDACKKHKTSVLSLKIDSGFHQLGEYLEITTEKGDKFTVQDGEEPTITFQEVVVHTDYAVEVEERTILSYEFRVQKLENGKFSHRGKTYHSENDLIEALEHDALSENHYADITDVKLKITKSQWVQ